jgi:hypothetical protein
MLAIAEIGSVAKLKLLLDAGLRVSAADVAFVREHFEASPEFMRMPATAVR